MKNINNSAKGWQNVFYFTYIQHIKNKSFITSTAIISCIIIAFILCLNFVIPALKGDNSVKYFKGNLYICDESGIKPEPDFYVLKKIGINVKKISKKDFPETENSVRNSSEKDMLVRIYPEKNNLNNLNNLKYFIKAYRPLNDNLVGGKDCNYVTSVMSEIFRDAKFKSLGLTNSEIIKAKADIITEKTIAGEEPKSSTAEVLNGIVPVIVSVMLFLFIYVYGVFVAQSVATEKSSRVMELLLTSIRPLAVIVGKVLAMGLASLTQILFFGTVSIVTTLVSAPFGYIGKILSSVPADDPNVMLINSDLKNIFGNFNLSSVIGIVIVFLLGYLFYSLLFGIIGASVSRIEDLQTACQPVALIGIIGFYLSYIPSMVETQVGVDKSGVFTILARYLPISSPFSLPSAIILGEMKTSQVFISILVLLLFDVFMALVVARVYESIIIHTGSRIKIKDMIKIFSRQV